MLPHIIPLIFTFQSTLPRRERPFRILHTISIKYFNPRSREGSDAAFTVGECVLVAISIHAPAKGATPARGGKPHERNISIHAPAKGATALARRPLSLAKFQSTLPRRERRRPALTGGRTNPISIHAPAKGATSYHLAQLVYDKLFQSTLPRRERLLFLMALILLLYFNPRSREGSDLDRS